MSLIPVEGLWETHLTVSNLDRSIAFYSEVVGLTLAHTIPERHVAFFWIGRPRQSMLGLWSIHTSPMSMRLHLAFSVSVDSVVASIDALTKAGIEPLSGGETPIREPVVVPWVPAASVYFKDPDGHSLEFIAMLSGRPAPDLKRMPLSEWRALNPADA